MRLIFSFFVLITIMFVNLSSYSQTWNTFTTDHGWIKLGPANSEWAHIYTSQSKFIFNRDIYTSGMFSSYYGVDLGLKASDVLGLTIKSNTRNVNIGNSDSPFNDTRLFVETNSDWSGKVGVLAKSTFNGDWGYGYISAFSQSKFKAFATINYTTGDEVFLVKGNGHVFATEITVKYPPFPDYVFLPTYDLMSINQLSCFIKINGHLPNIPSASEIEKYGVGVGELQAKQMIKIEELTLYLIELNERIALLESEIKTLKDEDYFFHFVEYL